jgi:hypothetical protein
VDLTVRFLPARVATRSSRKESAAVARDEVVQLSPGWNVDPGVPDPILVQREDSAAILFHIAPDRDTVLVVFEGCLIARFGYPNDEGLGTHPLYAKGLAFYACQEVLDSSWPAELGVQQWAQNLRHFVITFHDSTFECLADDIRWEPVIGSPIEALNPFLVGVRVTRMTDEPVVRKWLGWRKGE